eukprot:TRINITY_DN1023_c0_g1_i5.p1 TRINITY_DN1023_c0_g1~~TRINITY_DN1023_c0_g1_i5.p1  ORF type:complete len:263 (-),score=55.11 TRINITY_DN1023_c0_g1_i5:441-1229(-)
MDAMEIGVLATLPGIKDKAKAKLQRQQEGIGNELQSALRDLIEALNTAEGASALLQQIGTTGGSVPSSPAASRNFGGEKASQGSPQALPDAAREGETGGSGSPGKDFGAAIVFSCLPFSVIGSLLDEVVTMWRLELQIKVLITDALLAMIASKDPPRDVVAIAPAASTSSDEEEGRVEGNTSALDDRNPTEEDTADKVRSSTEAVCPPQPSGGVRALLPKVEEVKRETLQVYLTAWMVEVHINRGRIKEICTMVEEEIRSNR